MKSIEFAKEYISKQGFKLLDDSDEHIAFRYQMNVIHLWGNEEEENFFFMTLPLHHQISIKKLLSDSA